RGDRLGQYAAACDRRRSAQWPPGRAVATRGAADALSAARLVAQGRPSRSGVQLDARGPDGPLPDCGRGSDEPVAGPAHLQTDAGGGVGAGERVVERAVRHELRAVGIALARLEDDDLVASHVRVVMP